MSLVKWLSFDVLLEMSQSQLLKTGVCYMSILYANDSQEKGHVNGLCLVDFGYPKIALYPEGGCKTATHKEPNHSDYISRYELNT